MAKSTRVAIPTDDGVSVKQDFRGPRAFVVATIRKGMIVRQELRWNLLSEVLTRGKGFYYNLAGCDVVIVNEISSSYWNYLDAIKIKIHRTEHPEISKALIDYLEGAASKSEEKQIA